jgi:YD repeat-containing protein
MKRIIISLGCVLLLATVSFGQSASAKKDSKKNLTVKTWKTPVKGTKYLDHVTKYDENGRKVEEIEYNANGMTARETYEYDANGRVVREVVYNEHNKPYRIHKIEYNADGTKKRQLNYNAKGVLISMREYEYVRK